MFESIDEDILAMPVPILQKLYQQRRNEARVAITTITATGNDNCWDDMLRTMENLLPPTERTLFKPGGFNMSGREILGFCHKWVEHQKKLGNVLPDKPLSIE